MHRRFVVRLVSVAGALAAAGVGSTAIATRQSTVCTTLAITALHFHPGVIAPGGSATVRLRARNCTTQAQTATLTWLGRFSDASGGLPAGCPVIDPLAQPVQVWPRGIFRAHLGFTVPGACTATALQETARLTGAGGVVLNEQTATRTIIPPGP